MNGARRHALGAAPLRIAAFAALAALVATQWARLVEAPPAGHVALVVLLLVAGAGALALVAARRPKHAMTTVVAGVALIVAVAVGLVAAGVPARLLEPGGWGELLSRIGRGFSGMSGTVDYPYDGANGWTRIVILAGLPVALGIAAALAFWPGDPSPGAQRTAPLVVLAATLGFATVVVIPAHPFLWSLLFLVGIGAWQWLPSLSARDALAGAALLVAAGALALPIAGVLDRDKPLIDFREWRFGRDEPDTFNWNHTYGRLDWPRSGTALAAMQTNRREYWKTAVLSEFDGTRWRQARQPTGTSLELPTQVEGGPAGATLRQRHPEWIETVGVTIGPMQSRFVLAPGELVSVDGVDGLVSRPDGTTIAGNRALQQGDSYSEIAYVPDPKPRQLRSAPGDYPFALSRYTRLTLPGHQRTSGPEFTTPASHPPVEVPLRGDSSGGDRAASRAIASSPYAPTYRLAQRLTEGKTTYGATKAVERYLHKGFAYNEDPPQRRFPLQAFLSKDRIGYCQQFSGAMALMLRMSGIPTRVVSGFSPGSPDPKNRDRYLVEDLDAHSWVEVYFPTIGWVTFDPTPASAPAAGRSPDTQLASAAAIKSLGPTRGNRRRAFTPGQTNRASASSGGGVFPLWVIPAGIGGLALLSFTGVAGLIALRHLHYRRLSPEEKLDALLQELPRALARLNWPIRPGETLLALERRLHRRHKLVSARYVAKLRTARFSRTSFEPATLRDRNALRTELTSARLGSRVCSHVLLPPGAPRTGHPPKRGI